MVSKELERFLPPAARRIMQMRKRRQRPQQTSSITDKYLPPMVRRIKRAKEQAAKKTARAKEQERRGGKRLSLQEINTMGEDQLRQNLKAVMEKEDRRPVYVKILDMIDAPRNVVANVVGSIAGVDKTKARRGAFGQKKVYMSDVLKKIGVRNKVARGVAGFIGDVAIDPLTYLTAGALTGTKIAKHMPKVLPRGMKAGKGLATAMVHGGRIAPEMAKAVGASERVLRRYGQALVAKHGVKGAMKQLAGKRGGIVMRRIAKNLAPMRETAKSMQRLKGAAAFARKYGEKGRTIARVPFMAKGLTVPGKRAEMFKMLGTKEGLAKIMGQLGAKGSEAANAIQKARLAVEAFMKSGRAAAAKKGAITARLRAIQKAQDAVSGVSQGHIRQALQAQVDDLAKGVPELQKAYGKAQAIAKGAAKTKRLAATEAGRAQAQQLAAMTDPTAPLGIQGVGRAMYGETVPAAGRVPEGASAMQRVKWAIQRGKRKVFGAAPHSVGQQVHAGRQRATLESAQAGIRTFREHTKLSDPIIKQMATKLTHLPEGQRIERARAMLNTAIEYSDETIQAAFKGGRGLQADPAIATLGEFRRMFGSQFDDYIAKYRQLFAETGEALGKKLRPGQGTMFRGPSKEAARALGREGEIGRSLPFDPQRKQVIPMIRETPLEGAGMGPGVPQEKLVQSATSQAQQLADEGYRAAQLTPKGAPQGFFPSQEMQNVAYQQQQPWIKDVTGPMKGKGPFFETEPAMQAAEGVRRAKAELAQRELAQMVSQHGVRVDPSYAQQTPELAHLLPVNITRSHPLYRTIGASLEGRVFPEPVARSVNDWLKAFSPGQQHGLEGALRLSDTLYRHWKSMALIHPSYMLRNVGQAFIGGKMVGASAVKQAHWSRKMAPMVDDVLTGKVPSGTMQLAGKTISKVDFANSIKQYNMFNSMMTSDLLRGGNPSRWANRGYQSWFNWNNKIETRLRVGLVASLMDEGLSVREASMKVLRAMPDLSDLTVLEKGFFKRMFPWYAWMRRNTGVQLDFLANQPSWLAGAEKVKHNLQEALVGSEKVPEELRPEWMGTQQALQITGDDNAGTVWLLASWLPFQDLVKIGAGTLSLKDGARFAVEQMRPEMKTVAEYATGHDIFRGRKIDPQQGVGTALLDVPAAVFGASGTPLDNIFALRVAREGRRLTEMPDWESRALRATLGGALQPVDREHGERAQAVEIRQRISRLRSDINRAKQVGDEALVKKLMTAYMRLVIEAHKKGYSGVAKATGSMLEQQGIQAPPQPAGAF